MRSAHAQRRVLLPASDGLRSLPHARRTIHRTTHTRGVGTIAPGAVETWSTISREHRCPPCLAGIHAFRLARPPTHHARGSCHHNAGGRGRVLAAHPCERESPPGIDGEDGPLDSRAWRGLADDGKRFSLAATEHNTLTSSERVYANQGAPPSTSNADQRRKVVVGFRRHFAKLDPKLVFRYNHDFADVAWEAAPSQRHLS